MTAPTIELLQFRYSHYNEKVRWALDWKRLPHTRRSLLPGPHGPLVLRLTGRTQVPVLRVDGRVVAGSAAIIDVLERLCPVPALYPGDPAVRRDALALQRHFDDEVGPAVRLGFFAHVLDAPDWVCSLFSGGRPWLVRTSYRRMFPLTRRLMARSMGIRGPAAIDRACAATARALDLVAERGGRGAPLVGDSFGVADLTAAALLAPAVCPDHPETAYPEPWPDGLARWLGRWREHPGAAWVRACYRDHRPRPPGG